MSETYYADSSALVKRHISEAGSAWIEKEFDAASGNKIITTKLSVAEVLSAMNRRRREANITAAEYAKFSGDFLSFVETDYEMVEMSDAVLLGAQRLLENYPLRAGDAGLTRLCSTRQVRASIRQSSRADFPRLRRASFDSGNERRLANRLPAESLVFRIDCRRRGNK